MGQEKSTIMSKFLGKVIRYDSHKNNNYWVSV